MTTRRVLALVAGMVLLGGAALAVTPFFVTQKDAWLFKRNVTVVGVSYLDGGVAIGPSGTFIGGSYSGSIAWDFPALGNTALDTPCSETDPIVTTGAAIGDSCSASTNLGADGGAGLLSTATLSCRVSAANRAIAQLCVRLTDAGSYNLGDAGFSVRTFR